MRDELSPHTDYERVEEITKIKEYEIIRKKPIPTRNMLQRLHEQYKLPTIQGRKTATTQNESFNFREENRNTSIMQEYRNMRKKNIPPHKTL